MNKSLIETHVLNFIEINNGLKGVDLNTKIMGLELNITYNEIMDIVFDMVQEGKIVEIELVMPNNTSKSFLVPKGTKVNVLRMRYR